MNTYLVDPLAIKACAYFAADAKTRPSISGVLCEFFPNGVRYVATNGRTLGVVTDAASPIPADGAPEYRLTLDAGAVAAILKTWKATKHRTIGVTVGEAGGRGEDWVIPLWIDGADTAAAPTYSQIRYQYPNWRQAVPRRSWVPCVSPLCSLDSAYAAQVGAFYRTLTDPKDKRALAECTFHGVAAPDVKPEHSRIWLATTAYQLTGRLTAYAICMGVAMPEGHVLHTLADKSLPFPS